MKARIKVKSFDNSMWGGLQPRDYQENVYLVEKGDSISTVGLGDPYRFEITGIRSNVVDLVVSPELVLQSEGSNRFVGSVTLDVGDAITLQTMSFDAWGNWVVTLQGIL